MIVGLTGGIATGKSTVTGMLRDLGAYVVDADVWARKVVEPGSDGLQEIAETFGKGVLREDGSLNRAALGQLIFANSSARQQLNDITHPRVRAGMKAESKTYLTLHPNQPIVWDVPLLFEGETLQLVDTTVLVYAPQHVQLERLMARDGYSEADARARIEAQLSIEEKRALAANVIDNSTTLANTRNQVVRIWQRLLSQAAAEAASQ